MKSSDLKKLIAKRFPDFINYLAPEFLTHNLWIDKKLAPTLEKMNLFAQSCQEAREELIKNYDSCGELEVFMVAPEKHTYYVLMYDDATWISSTPFTMEPL